MDLDINWIAVVVTAVATFVLDGTCYGALFGNVRRNADDL